jgi:predicted Ser/Thr protein kinase
VIHLSPEIVQRYGSGQLQGEALREAERHLAQCDACTARVETERLGQEATSPHATEPRLPAAPSARLPISAEVGGEDSTFPGKTLPGGPEPVRPARPPEVSSSGALARGAVVGRYLIVDQLGQGGMGAVYLAYDPELDRRVALKLLRPEHGDDQAELMRARLVREAKAMARLAHPNVVAVYDAGAFGRRVFVAMEYVDGPDLGRWLASSPRGWREILARFVEAGRGLAAAHAAGLVHRDFKADNVLLASDGRVKVTDFGLAHVEGKPRSALSMRLDLAPELPALTSPGAMIGTPLYMAPEQFLGKPADARTDQFNFCAALYEALYGVPPFGGDDVVKIGKRVVTGESPVPPGDVDVPGWVRERVLRGLRREPAERHESLQALLDALADDPAVARRRGLLLAGAGLALVAALGVGGRALWLERTQCGREADAAVAFAWNPEHAQKVAAAAGDPAEGALEVEHLGAYAASLRAARRAVCQDGQRHAISAGAGERRERCLRQRISDLASVVEQLEVPDPKLRRLLLATADQLYPASSCQAVDAARPGGDEGADADRAISRAHLLMTLGRFADAQALLEPVERDAVARDDREAQAMVQEERAEMLLRRQEHLDEALESYRRCALLGEAASDDALTARCRVGQVMIAGEFLNRYDEAARMAEEARAAIVRLGPGVGGRAEGHLDRVLGNIAVNRGDRAGVKLLAQAVEESRAFYGRDVPDLAIFYNDYGRAVGELEGDAAASAQLFQKAAELAIAGRGPDSPEVITYWENAGEAEALADHPAQALQLIDRAREVARRGAGKELQGELGYVLTDRAEALVELKRYAEAQADVDRAAHLMEGLEPDSSTQAAQLSVRAELALAANQPEAARRLAEEALTLAAQRPGEQQVNAQAKLALVLALPPTELPRARALAEEARKTYRAMPAARPQRLAKELDAWLAEHPAL